MKKNILTIIVILFSFNIVYAFGDYTHCVYGMYFLQNSNSEIAKMCRSYEDYFLFGCFEPDITVFDYFREDGVLYKATHNWGFQQAIMERATDDALRCYSYGIGICHYGLDIVSHNYMVPEVIQKYGVPNAGSHVAIEGNIEFQMINKNPQLHDKCLHMLDLGLEKSPKYDKRVIEITQEAVGKNSPTNVKHQTELLAGALGNLYSKAFVVKPEWKGLSEFMTNILSEPTYYYKYATPYWNDIPNSLAYQKMEWLSNNWALRNTVETPHGLDTLTKADRSIGHCFDNWCIFRIPNINSGIISILTSLFVWFVSIIMILLIVKLIIKI